MASLIIARNPDRESTLPYVMRVPIGTGLHLLVRDTWPRTAAVYCHPAPEWPIDAEIVEEIPVRSCTRRGPAIDLLLDRGKEKRSQIVFTRLKTGREVIFWQTAMHPGTSFLAGGQSVQRRLVRKEVRT